MLRGLNFSKSPLSCLLLSALCVGYTAPAFAEGPRPNIKGASLIAPMTIDGDTRLSLWIFPSSAEDSFWIEWKTFSEALLLLVKEEDYEKLSSLVDKSKETISVAALKSLGYAWSFDEATLETTVGIPYAVRKSATYSLSSTGKLANNPQRSAPYSGYVNMFTYQPFVYPDSKDYSGRSGLENRFEMSQQLYGYVLKTEAEYSERQKNKWRSGETALIKDFESPMIRTSIGDVHPAPVSFQSSRPLGGFSIHRNFGLQPYRSARPMTRTSLNIKTPSTLEIFVNGELYKTLRVGVGPVELTDFPLSSGLNEVFIRSKDAQGRIEEIKLSSTFDPQLLAPGLAEFGATIGYASEITGAGRRYKKNQQTVSLYQRIGLLDNTTAGANVQSDPFQTLAGLEGLWLSRVGLWSVEEAVSHVNGLGSGNALRLRYKTPDRWGKDRAPFLFRAGTQFQDERFAQLGTLRPAQSYKWSIEGSISTQLWKKISTTLGAQYLRGRHSQPHAWVGSLDINRSIFENVHLGTNMSWSEPDKNQRRIFISLSWIEPVKHLRSQSSYDSRSEEMRSDFEKMEHAPADDYRYGAGIAKRPDSSDVTANVKYIGYRGVVGLDHNTRWYEKLSPSTTNTTGLRASTAIAWTNESITWGRSISDSFAILKLEGKNVDALEVGVNRVGDKPAAKTDRWGPALLPDMTSYYDRALYVDAIALPPGVQLLQESYVLKPSYHSGITARVQIDQRIALRGYLIEKGGTPLSLSSGEIVDVKTSKTVAQFFTNRKGRFMVESIDPGQYEIRVYDKRWAISPFEIPANAAALFSLPPIELVPQSKENTL